MATSLLNQRFRIVRPVAGGTEGTVFLAEEAGRPLAIKRVTASQAEARDRLAGEFLRLSRLDHPNLVRVRDLETVREPVDGFEAGALFFTAEYVDGATADAALAAAPPARRLPLLLAIAEDVAAALAHLHAAGLLHCDVKPANLLVVERGGEPSAVLVDLGLAQRAGGDGAGEAAGAARGTPIYMAPEALAGWAEQRSDLFALGAALVHVASGELPRFGRVAPAAEVAPWLPAPLAELLDQLRAADPERRPSSALVLLDHLARVRDAVHLPPREAPRLATRSAADPTGRAAAFAADPARGAAGGELPAVLLPPRLVGRDAALARLTGALARLSRGEAAPRALRIAGPPGSGRSALLDEAVRRHQLAAARGDVPALLVCRGEPDLALDWLRVDRAGALGPAALADRALAGLAARAAARPVLLAIEHAGPLATALLRLAPHHPALAGASAAVLAWSDDPEPPDPDAGDRAIEIAAAPLDAEAIGQLASSMLARPVPAAWAQELARACEGLPGLAAEVVRAAAQLAGPERADTLPPASLLTGTGADALAALVRRRAAALPAELTAVLEAAAVQGARAPVEGVAAILDRPVIEVYSAAADLAARGFVAMHAADIALPTAQHARALDEAIPSARRRALHRAALRWLERDPAPDPLLRARHLAVTGPAERATRAALAAAAALADRGEGDEARRWAERAAAAAPAELSALAHAVWSERAAAVGRYDEACEAARRAVRARDPALCRRAVIALTRAQQRAGALDDAEATLRKLRRDHPDDDEAAALAARLAIARARYREAAEIAGRPALSPPQGGPALSSARAMRLEAAGLAHLYLGDLAAAEVEFAALEAGARAAQDRARLGRALGLRGMAAQTRGDVAAAALLYAAASGEARAAGDVHAAAVYDLNQATAHAERGRHGLALGALGRALAELRALGDVAELAAALYNRGIAQLALGAVAAARRSADEALARAEARGTPEMQTWARLLDGDVARREGDLARAGASYRAALALAEEAELGRPRMLARLSLAEILAEGRAAGAADELARAADDAGSDDDRDRLLCARGRVALSSGAGDAALASALAAAGARSRLAGRLDLAWRAEALAARVLAAAGDGARAAELAASARAELGRIADDTPEAHRADLGGDPDAQGLAALERELAGGQRGADSAPGEPASGFAAGAGPGAGHLRRLLALSRRLNSELRLEPLLDDVIDTAIELTSAERGFLLLYPPGRRDELDIVVARNIDQESLAGPEVRLSRSIAERAARSGEIQLTVDAAFDERFGAAESVTALRLRSVLAAPLRQKGRIIGTIYVDHRFRAGAFDAEAVELACELADIAAVAIENARLVEENRQRQEEIDALNRRLSDDLGRREEELAQVKARLSIEDGRAALRHPYAGLIGRSPAMLELLRTLDRVTASHLPVVVAGESGSGKELVARALHEHGPRRDGPFVAVNCGALPDQLLESELFGHVRGAFTGADRDRRGLFEVASGGTLFLDEVADTSLAMQSKLLRVLQEGELRRVGDERTRTVDVRVVAASNRDLEDLVARGEFREDLYYRLSVLRVRVPPLRERVADIPELAAHLLARLARGGRPPELGRAALAKLCAYGWPGNVRELENELARAAALADGAIGPGDLSPQVVAAPPARAPRGRELHLRAQVEALERQLVEEALRRTGGNQTAAARLLGLSRYGLQKKLRRYGIAAPTA